MLTRYDLAQCKTTRCIDFIAFEVSVYVRARMAIDRYGREAIYEHRGAIKWPPIIMKNRMVCNLIAVTVPDACDASIPGEGIKRGFGRLKRIKQNQHRSQYIFHATFLQTGHDEIV